MTCPDALEEQPHPITELVRALPREEHLYPREEPIQAHIYQIRDASDQEASQAVSAPSPASGA